MPPLMRAANKCRYLFGPVLSRRFGRSLGVDLVPRKRCTYDCVFCQVGGTTDLTLERAEHVPTGAVIEELETWLVRGISADFITLSGSGEPTLHSRFGDILDAVHAMSPTRTALLTNGSLLHLEEVRSAAARAGVVKVSLSAWDQDSFARINRPHRSLTFDRFMEGLRAFRAGFRGELWVEVFVLPGFNATEEAMQEIAGLAGSVRPDRIHLNTVTRPPSDRAAVPVCRDLLESLRSCFVPMAEVLEDARVGRKAGTAPEQHEILSILRRRPCTADDIAGAFGMAPAEAEARMASLARSGCAREARRGGKTYYVAARNE